MDSYRVVFSDGAISDLFAVYEYIAKIQLEPDNAKELIRKIKEAVDSLSIFPKRHPVVTFSPLKEEEMRYFAIKNYNIYYLVDDENHLVNIVRIFSCRHRVVVSDGKLHDNV